jgi:hypothetical protein
VQYFLCLQDWTSLCTHSISDEFALKLWLLVLSHRLRLPSCYLRFRVAAIVVTVQGLPAVQVTPFVPSDNVRIETDPAAKGPPEDTPMAADDESRIDELLTELDSITRETGASFKMTPITFEKDDDTNYHMDLITSLANNRARNYQIPEVCICSLHPARCQGSWACRLRV